jgi:acetyl/propionyl-CoA carboxylase alpha subunit/acetyl-CoA carboxylase carboxyltransferase component
MTGRHDVIAHTVLVANRGEIAIRICRAVAELGWRSVVVYSEDDAAALHTRQGDVAVALGVAGSAAYLDIARLIAVARQHGCTMVHPGYGFLSERADFALQCEDAGLIFAGPKPGTLATFGNKAEARKLAADCDVPLPRGTGLLSSADDALAFMQTLGPQAVIMLKAAAGGGGRGIRIVRDPASLAADFARCGSEATAAFGNGDVYAEEFVENARHIEVQLAGDDHGNVIVLGDRECSLQRRQQKLIELAPSPGLGVKIRRELYAATLRMAKRVSYRGLGTFEFLVRAADDDDKADIRFMEVNPRLQVEHTVTEQVTGIDLVQLQLRIAAGVPLDRSRLPDPECPQGMAMQLRINAETMRPNGTATPSTGTISAFDLPAGPGLRVDSAAYVGYPLGASFDSLLAKVIVHTVSGDYAALVRKAYRALRETHIGGIASNLDFLRALLRHPQVAANQVHTRFIDDNMAELAGDAATAHPLLVFPRTAASHAQPQAAAMTAAVTGPAGTQPVLSPMTCRVVDILVQVGDEVKVGQPLAVTEAMKMEFVVEAAFGGTVAAVAAGKGVPLAEGSAVLHILPNGSVASDETQVAAEQDLDLIRDDLAAVMAAHARLEDAARPDAVARRRKTGQRTARENVADLCDARSFQEYGGLAVAAQTSRRDPEELQRISPADGLITGVGTINAGQFGADRTRCAVLAYDYTVFAGTQGVMAHTKKRRIFRLATKWRLPVIMFAEGGGGRPGDTDDNGHLRLHNASFWALARLSGEVPIISIISGRCFAGNAALASCADVIIACENASIGMGGPAMIEGGGLGVVAAEDVGPVAMQSRNGVVDIVVKDEAAAVAAAKKFIGYFQGPLKDWTYADQRHLRHIVPEEPRRAYSMRTVIEALADTDSVLELRPNFGIGIITSLVRIAGQPIAIIANNPAHLAGAIDAEATDKAARFSDLAETLRLPLLTLCDTPGFMVGPDAEKEALVRRAGHMFVSGSKRTVPQFMVVVRKAYGLGALAMVGGNSFEPLFCVAWPTGHFGKMGLEGQVKLAYRKELDAIADPAAREVRIRQMVSDLHDRGSALNSAPYLSIDDVIDPAETRDWILAGLQIARQRGDLMARQCATTDAEPFGSAWFG